jgi:hypothetical protein
MSFGEKLIDLIRPGDQGKGNTALSFVVSNKLPIKVGYFLGFFSISGTIEAITSLWMAIVSAIRTSALGPSWCGGPGRLDRFREE